MSETNDILQSFVGQKFKKARKGIEAAFPKTRIITYEGGFPGNYPGCIVVLIGSFGKIQTIRMDP